MAFIDGKRPFFHFYLLIAFKIINQALLMFCIFVRELVDKNIFNNDFDR